MVKIREDFRRDGLSMNFLVDENMMLQLARAFPNAIFNIGYPSICSREQEMCKKITYALKDEPVESAVVGHALPKHLEIMSSIANSQNNTSANFWIPFSDYMISQTLKIEPEKVLKQAKTMMTYWNDLSDKPMDIAFVDATAKEKHLRERLKRFYHELKKEGVRTIIVCDTKGNVTPKNLTDLLVGFRNTGADIEYHPHNDNGMALMNIETAVLMGAKAIGTSIYGLGERGTMVDPRKLVAKYDIAYDPSAFQEFRSAYRNMIKSLGETEAIFVEGIVVTGTQYRLRGRDSSIIAKFGITSDKFILSQLTGIPIKEISDSLLSAIKDELFVNRKRIFSKEEILTKLRK